MQELHAWFSQNKREFPWRQNPTPYKVWVSEVMLQQTRASVVIPYFERWMDLFPDLFALANAPIEQVIKAWEGLGYYSRARNLHRGAKQIVEEFGGKLPEEKETLKKIYGLGPYTVGAILSFGFKKRAAAVDGNVLRVLTRYFSIEENICKAPVRRKIEEKALKLLDEKTPWVTAEALIELGATICRPKPDCLICPLQKKCLGQARAEALPIKNEPPAVTFLKRAVLLIETGDQVLVKKGEKGKVMADLYEFPYFEFASKGKLIKIARQELGLDVVIEKTLLPVEHTFTRYKAKLYPYLAKAKEFKEVKGYSWVLRSKLSEFPFSSGHRKILNR